MQTPEHLSHLHQWQGMPIPFVNLWTDEDDDEHWTYRMDPVVHELAVYSGGTQGVGDAILVKQNPQRERRCATLYLCQVCARQLSPKLMFLVLSGRGFLETVDVDDLEAPQTVTIEPWLCRRCCDFAMEKCPGLIRRRREDDLKAFRVIRHRLIASRAWLDTIPESKEDQPILWVKIQPLEVEEL